MPTITTILPTYKRPMLLNRAIDSVRSQTWRDVEIMVRDNCSEDATEQLVCEIAKIDPRVKFIKNAANIGPHENIRLGLDDVKTEFFSILSDDDYLNPDFYSYAMRVFDQYPDAGFVACSVNTVNLNGEILNVDGKKLNSGMCDGADSIKPTYYSSDEGMAGYLSSSFPYTWTGYVFRREVASFVRMPDFCEVGYGGDIFFIWCAAAKFNFVVSNFRGANITAHTNSVSSTLVNVFDERFLYWWRNRLNIIRNDPLVSASIKSIISEYYFSNSTKSFKYLKHYMHAAIILILDRVRSGRVKELKYDFIEMRSFVPWSILIGIKYCIVVLVYLKLDIFLRNFIRRARDSFKIT
jgi:glycosyltransferase involved in cell wall biosynthesis